MRPEGEDKDKRTENLFEEIIAENFLNLGKKRDIQAQEAQNPEQDEPKKVHTKTRY